MTPSPSTPSDPEPPAPFDPPFPDFPWYVNDPSSARYECMPDKMLPADRLNQIVGCLILAASLGLVVFVTLTNRRQWALRVFYSAGVLGLIIIFGSIFYWTFTRGYYTPMADILDMDPEQYVKVEHVIMAKRTSSRCRRDVAFVGFLVAILVVATMDEWLNLKA